MKVNKKLRLKKNPDYSACLESLSEMENAVDLEDLKMKFSTLIKKFPKFKLIYTDKYREKTLELTAEKG